MTDRELAVFATPAWVDGVASVPLDEMCIMVAEDPSVVTALIGALRSARADADCVMNTLERLRIAAIGPGFHEPPITSEQAVLGELESLRSRLAAHLATEEALARRIEALERDLLALRPPQLVVR